jgi:hypothetical protein
MIRSARCRISVAGKSCRVTLQPSTLSMAVTEGVENGNRRGMKMSGEHA